MVTPPRRRHGPARPTHKWIGRELKWLGCFVLVNRPPSSRPGGFYGGVLNQFSVNQCRFLLGGDLAMDAKLKFDCTIYDAAEGRLHITVQAADEDAAHEEASIAAAERGCSHITEIVVGVFE